MRINKIIEQSVGAVVRPWSDNRTLRQIAIFCGGFTREATQQITGAGLSALLGLMRKSLILGHAQAAMQQWSAATASYQADIAYYAQLDNAVLAVEAQAGLAQVALAQEELAQAQQWVETLLPILAEHLHAGFTTPFGTHLTCYRVLAANQDARAAALIEVAYKLLQEYAASIHDAPWQKTFLENVRVHRQIQQLYGGIPQRSKCDCTGLKALSVVICASVKPCPNSSSSSALAVRPQQKPQTPAPGNRNKSLSHENITGGFSPMIIRTATLADAPGMAHVMVDSWLAAHRGQVPDAQWQQRRDTWTYADSERGWRRALTEIATGSKPQECIYVAVTTADKVVGVAVGCPAELELLPNAAEVSVLYVHPTAQGQGVGRRLVQQVAAHQAARGKQALLISCLATNTPARRFYEALGGQVVGTHETEDEGFREPQVIYGWADIQDVVEGTDKV